MCELPGTSKDERGATVKADVVDFVLPCLSDQICLEELWDTLGECLIELALLPDNHAVLVLQPAVEAFFLVHAGETCTMFLH